jgi:hypothetical protein
MLAVQTLCFVFLGSCLAQLFFHYVYDSTGVREYSYVGHVVTIAAIFPAILIIGGTLHRIEMSIWSEVLPTVGAVAGFVIVVCYKRHQREKQIRKSRKRGQIRSEPNQIIQMADFR